MCYLSFDYNIRPSHTELEGHSFHLILLTQKTWPHKVWDYKGLSTWRKPARLFPSTLSSCWKYKQTEDSSQSVFKRGLNFNLYLNYFLIKYSRYQKPLFSWFRNHKSQEENAKLPELGMTTDAHGVYYKAHSDVNSLQSSENNLKQTSTVGLQGSRVLLSRSIRHLLRKHSPWVLSEILHVGGCLLINTKLIDHRKRKGYRRCLRYIYIDSIASQDRPSSHYSGMLFSFFYDTESMPHLSNNLIWKQIWVCGSCFFSPQWNQATCKRSFEINLITWCLLG